MTKSAWRYDCLSAREPAYAEVNHGRIEKWHPAPESFYDVGILWDVAVYPLTHLTAFFGPPDA